MEREERRALWTSRVRGRECRAALTGQGSWAGGWWCMHPGGGEAAGRSPKAGHWVLYLIRKSIKPP